MRPHKVEFYKDRSGGWRWRLVAGNGCIIASSSESYAKRWNARRAWFGVYDALRSGIIDVRYLDT